ncbi:uncharacterized protein BDCG_00374 [Blastomyces dermatitidis ER-3]|uniref:Uncharacterized protein n=2 Tax=Ajellomyces dermatitidis TaxID=5039 RepID=F2TR24_AJEDA|nr:uncharacterized protein BDCG_00374 [Blastomyces dermatitidis ER-3]EEQ83569.1 hypothetical protein BDCG_00374 [Blastomyces dermatitidis ER-3]EGE85687.1 hypothetical protein BDDG_08632 [Blastomyces dermatitidis ATCC 18188]
MECYAIDLKFNTGLRQSTGFFACFCLQVISGAKRKSSRKNYLIRERHPAASYLPKIVTTFANKPQPLAYARFAAALVCAYHQEHQVNLELESDFLNLFSRDKLVKGEVERNAT